MNFTLIAYKENSKYSYSNGETYSYDSDHKIFYSQSEADIAHEWARLMCIPIATYENYYEFTFLVDGKIPDLIAWNIVTSV